MDAAGADSISSVGATPAAIVTGYPCNVSSFHQTTHSDSPSKNANSAALAAGSMILQKRYHTELLKRLGMQFPHLYVTEGQPVGFVPCISLLNSHNVPEMAEPFSPTACGDGWCAIDNAEEDGEIARRHSLASSSCDGRIRKKSSGSRRPSFQSPDLDKRTHGGTSSLRYSLPSRESLRSDRTNSRTSSRRYSLPSRKSLRSDRTITSESLPSCDGRPSSKPLRRFSGSVDGFDKDSRRFSRTSSIASSHSSSSSTDEENPPFEIPAWLSCQGHSKKAEDRDSKSSFSTSSSDRDSGFSDVSAS